ncbi:acyl carrier protein [Ekhidna sp.]|uniref:acyl carrier protein n=1 Tax=Ekhidna sp. TaxID=2608089 RepID=UPI003B511683
MESKNIHSQLSQIIGLYLPDDINADSITDDQHLINDLRINSVHIVDIVLDIEEQFNITIDDEAIGEINTVGDALKAIKEATNN